jgi:Na+/H+-translocating membrane pyrophosphatase
MVGYGFGASFVALFMQLGGGIYTKAADVGADMVGKIEVLFSFALFALTPLDRDP